jgi:hypothetical protein
VEISKAYLAIHKELMATGRGNVAGSNFPTEPFRCFSLIDPEKIPALKTKIFGICCVHFLLWEYVALK